MLSKIVTQFLRRQLLLGKNFQLYSWDGSSKKVVASGKTAKIIHVVLTLLHVVYVCGQLLTIFGTSSCSTPGARVTATLFTMSYLTILLLECELAPDPSAIELLNTITNTEAPRKSMEAVNIHFYSSCTF